jgi:hypothetical protein
VYYHDQTVAVVELGPGKRLENCELVEVTWVLKNMTSHSTLRFYEVTIMVS